MAVAVAVAVVVEIDGLTEVTVEVVVFTEVTVETEVTYMDQRCILSLVRQYRMDLRLSSRCALCELESRLWYP